MRCLTAAQRVLLAVPASCCTRPSRLPDLLQPQDTAVSFAVTEGCFQHLTADASMLLQAPKEAASRAKVVSDAAPKAPGAEVLVAGAAALALVGGVGLAAAKNDPASSSAPSGRRTGC